MNTELDPLTITTALRAIFHELYFQILCYAFKENATKTTTNTCFSLRPLLW